MNPRRSATLAVAFYPAAVVAGWAFVSLAGIGLASHRELRRGARRGSPRAIADRQHRRDGQPQTTCAASPCAASDSRLAPQTNAQRQLRRAMSCPIRPKWRDRRRRTRRRSPSPTCKPVAEPGGGRAGTTSLRPRLAGRSGANSAAGNTVRADGRRQPRPIRCRRTRRLKTHCLKASGLLQAASSLSASAWWQSPASTSICSRSTSGRPRKTPSRRPRSARWRSSGRARLVTVTRSFTKLVENDFTWKDPKAAERVGMSMSDYVIGGMDQAASS